MAWVQTARPGIATALAEVARAPTELPDVSWAHPEAGLSAAGYGAAATREGARKAVAEEKLTGLIEISEVRESDHGPGRFIVCLRGAEQASSPRRTYAVFFDDEIYKGVRLSVMVDDCEKRDFRPF